MANPIDTTYHLIAETTAGTTPATPAFQKVDNIPGTMPQFTSEFIESPVLKPSRAAGVARKNNYSVNGGLETQLKRDAAHDILLQSALSGTYATNVLKASNVDSSFTIEKKMIEGAGALYKRFVGCQVSSFKLSVDASGIAKSSFDILGMNMPTPTTAILTGATYVAAASTTMLTGNDVSSVTIAGLTATFRSLELSVEHDRQVLDQFGSASALAVRTGGIRKVKLAMTFYRADLTPETTLLNDTPVAVSFTIGATTNGYTFTLPAATCTVPQDEEDGAKALVSVEFTASYDNTAGTDISITKVA